jgi:hypothetical protein
MLCRILFPDQRKLLLGNSDPGSQIRNSDKARGKAQSEHGHDAHRNAAAAKADPESAAEPESPRRNVRRNAPPPAEPHHTACNKSPSFYPQKINTILFYAARAAAVPKQFIVRSS